MARCPAVSCTFSPGWEIPQIWVAKCQNGIRGARALYPVIIPGRRCDRPHHRRRPVDIRHRLAAGTRCSRTRGLVFVSCCNGRSAGPSCAPRKTYSRSTLDCQISFCQPFVIKRYPSTVIILFLYFSGLNFFFDFGFDLSHITSSSSCFES